MRERFQSPMALWRLHFYLLGGSRRLLGTILIYAAVLVCGAYGFRRIYCEQPLNTVASYILNGLAAIQVFIVIMGGCNAIYRANLRDYDSRMVESHRLTPMSNISVVLGYLFGATLQMQVLFFVGLAVGAVLTAMAQLPVAAWVGGNLFILNGAITLWAACLVSGLRLAKPISPVGFLVGAGALGNAGIVLLPAAGVLLCAYPIFFGYQIITGANKLTIEAIIIIASMCAVMTGFWVSAAAAKYRRPDLPALDAVRGLILLAFWVVAGVVGMVLYASPLVGPRVAPQDDEIMLVQWVATLGLSLLVALPAIGGSVECRALIRKGALGRGWGDRIPAWMVCLGAAAVILIPTAAIGDRLADEILPQVIQTTDAAGATIQIGGDGMTKTLAWALTSIAIVLALFTAKELHVVAYAALRHPRVLAAAILIFLWALPPLADSIRAEMISENDAYAPFRLTGLFGCSPAGTILACWVRNFSAPIAWGLVAQASTLVLLGFLSHQLVHKSGNGSLLARQPAESPAT